MPDAKTADMIEGVEAPIYLDYRFTAGKATTRFLHGLRKGVLVGQQCERCSKVYIPPRGSCPACGIPTALEQTLPDTGSVESFTIVHVPIPGNPIEPPYIVANIILDGADVSFIHLLSECEGSEVEIGMRVVAKWKAPQDWTYAMENIAYFVPVRDGAELPAPELDGERVSPA